MQDRLETIKEFRRKCSNEEIYSDQNMIWICIEMKLLRNNNCLFLFGLVEDDQAKEFSSDQHLTMVEDCVHWLENELVEY